MAYEKKEGDVSIFKNEKKTADNQPDYTGELLWKGETVRLAFWKKESAKGTFLAGKASEPREKTNG